MSELKYPRRKVFSVFFFCPFFLGLLAGIYKFFSLLAHLVNNPKLFGEVRGLELFLMPILAPVVSQLAFLPPFLIFAVVIAWMKVCRTSRNCVFVSLLGGLIATFWMLLFVVIIEGRVKSSQFSDYISEMAIVFFTSSVMCWFAARFFLPDPTMVR